MSNLGAYQWITTMSKKVGGPRNLLLLTASVGYGCGRIIEAGGKKIYKLLKKTEDGNLKKTVDDTLEYTVIKEGKSNEGVEFLIGDKFRVLEKDGDVILIEKLGDVNSPYYVSAKFLNKISEYAENREQ